MHQGRVFNPQLRSAVAGDRLQQVTRRQTDPALRRQGPLADCHVAFENEYLEPASVFDSRGDASREILEPHSLGSVVEKFSCGRRGSIYSRTLNNLLIVPFAELPEPDKDRAAISRCGYMRRARRITKVAACR